MLGSNGDFHHLLSWILLPFHIPLDQTVLPRPLGHSVKHGTDGRFMWKCAIIDSLSDCMTQV